MSDIEENNNEMSLELTPEEEAELQQSLQEYEETKRLTALQIELMDQKRIRDETSHFPIINVQQNLVSVGGDSANLHLMVVSVDTSSLIPYNVESVCKHPERGFQVEFLDKTNKHNFSQYNFIDILGYQTTEPDFDSNVNSQIITISENIFNEANAIFEEKYLSSLENTNNNP